MASTTLERPGTAAATSDVTPILEIEDLNISFFVRAGEIPAVMDFSCKVMPGETMGLVGESGCGKSTVALGIMRDMGNRGKIVGGKIKFKGRDMGDMSAEELRDIRGSKIAMIYQEPMASLNPAMKIGRQLMEVPLIHENVSKEEAYSRSLEMLRSVKLPDPERVMEAFPHQISGGQQQRVVIAMALLSKPDLLLLDEPTTALDVTVEAGIVELIKELARETGTSMLFISHNLGLILETCDRITVMYSGEAVETGTVHEVFDRMRHPYTQGLFNSIPLPGADKNSRPLIAIPGQLPLPMERPRGCNFGPRCDHYVEEKCNAAAISMQPIPGEERHYSRCVRIDEIDWGAEPERRLVADPAEPGDVVLDIRDMKKYYDVAANKMFGGGDTRTVKANESITFQAREAETVAIVGESGCGKSTLAKVLLGLETATDGDVVLGNVAIDEMEVGDRDKRTVASVQMVFQNPFDTLNPSHTVGAQIIRTLEKFGIGETVEDREQRMLELLDLVKLPRAFAERMPRQLSGGQKQRIGVARAFAGQPKLVVADEPVSALDVSVQAAVTELLMDIQREAKTTMLFISHDLSVVRYIADRVVVMYLGHIVEQGTTDDIFSPPYHPYTEALLSAIPIADTSVEKKHIVLDGDIPSAMNPPSGCPFQTRCPRKHQVDGDLCEREVPPMRNLGNGHHVKCHLADSILSSMEPVIVLGGEKSFTKDVTTQGEETAGDLAPVASIAAVGKTRSKSTARSESKARTTPGSNAKSSTRSASAGKAGSRTTAKPKTASAKKDPAPPRMRKPKDPDDLKMISGVGPKIEGILNGLGIYKFEQIAKWRKAERAWVDEKLRFKGRIEREDWVKQAKALAKGGEAEHVRVFGKEPR
ncbi:MAG: dipeptide ABC transporter ATP-binding protein [Ahrensia sp.]|nr:dipeptide ABC transporter ATP-binding protein [Ahrensia sp.]